MEADMNHNRQPAVDRHSAIIALAQARPELSYKAIGIQFGVSGSCVGQIIAGKRGKRQRARLRFFKDHAVETEFGAIRAIMSALEPLEEAAKERVIQFALSRLRDSAALGFEIGGGGPTSPKFNNGSGTPISPPPE
jgi:hypothetical protein